MLPPLQDFVNFHLTGRWVASLNNASIRWHYSTRRAGGWPEGMLRTLGLEALLHKWPAEVLPLGAVVGGLTAAAAEHLGLPQGVVVAQGGAGEGLDGRGVGRGACRGVPGVCICAQVPAALVLASCSAACALPARLPACRRRHWHGTQRWGRWCVGGLHSWL